MSVLNGNETTDFWCTANTLWKGVDYLLSAVIIIGLCP